MPGGKKVKTTGKGRYKTNADGGKTLSKRSRRGFVVVREIGLVSRTGQQKQNKDHVTPCP